ncbi:MAG: hypothetical protein Q7K26_01700 [bacterium]|nr:hypothetical protein [bacterium]
MKKLISVFFCFFAVAASAQDGVQFQITANKGKEPIKQFEVTTRPGSEAFFGAIASQSIANEVNSNLGEVQYKQVKIESGMSGKVIYVQDESARTVDVDAVIEYQILEQGTVLSKGRHHIHAKPGDVIKLPAANGIELKVTLKAA